MRSESVHPGAWPIAETTARFVLESGKNPVYSPVCIHEGLRALRLGAAGNSATELDGLVETAGGIQDRYSLAHDNADFGHDGYAAHIATGIWLDEKANPQDQFLAACVREGIACTQVPLESPSTSDDISQWITDRTDGLLKPRISLSPMSLACVVSALYFKDAWETHFLRMNTENDTFYSKKDAIETAFMVSENELRASDFDYGTIVERPLLSGGSMVLVLPETDTTLEELLVNESLWRDIPAFDVDPTNVELHLPKFTCELTVDNMAQTLVRAGFASAQSPDLIPMVGTAQTAVSYVHGAKISVDEDGLEGGAYFAVAACAGLPWDEPEPTPPRVIKFDKPFLYAVLSKNRQPLFIGTVTNPESDPFAWIPLPSNEEKGSEGGWIDLDEEIPDVCRITLETECPGPFYGITCGIYGWLVHTTWADDYAEAMLKYEGMKKDLRAYAAVCDAANFDSARWAEEFTGRW